MDKSAVARVRSFNRIVAERTGTIGDRFLDRPRPYGVSRILWHVGRDGADVRDLRRRLDLDSGYVSRVLRALQRERLITITSSRADSRVRHVSLTPAGRRECDEIDRRSEGVARTVLEPLNVKQRERLVAAMEQVETLLTASMVTFAAEDPASHDAQHCLIQYFNELKRRFEGGFDPAKSSAATIEHFKPPEGAFVIARLRGEPVACGAIIFLKGARAYFKRMWVSPRVRGLGLGRRLLEELEHRARAAGAKTACLETQRALREAIAMYRSAGYREVPPFNDEHYAHHWFEKRLMVKKVSTGS
jgi:DNA-binding MarR family transcriptional regulator/ribosomal protein S18 acetylase RimI-like enzyme